MAEKKKRQARTAPPYISPMKEKKRRNIRVYVIIPLCIFFLCSLFKFYVDGLSTLPPWLATLVGRRDPMASDFDDISFTPEHEIAAADDYADLSPDEMSTGDGYIDCMSTNDRYDELTCDKDAPTDIMVMDIVPRKLDDAKQSIMYVKLFNKGAAAEHVSIVFMTEDKQTYEGHMDVVPSCSSQARFRWTPKRKGQIKVTGIVNSDKNVTETDYENNSKTVTIYVGVTAPLVPEVESKDYVEWVEEGTGQTQQVPIATPAP